VPSDQDGLRRALAPLDRRYAGHIHAQMRRTGHFWQGRFGCVAMDEDHLAAAVRYVALNPVRARLSETAIDWPWSSTATLLGGDEDGVTNAAPVQARFADLAQLLESAEDGERTTALRRARRSAARSAAANGSRPWNAAAGVSSNLPRAGAGGRK